MTENVSGSTDVSGSSTIPEPAPDSPAPSRIHAPGRQLLGRGSIYTLGTTLQLAAAALAIPAATRLIGSAEFGTIALALSVQLLVIQLATLGLPLAVVRFYFGPDDGLHGEATSRALVTSAAMLAAAAIAIVMLTGLVWAPVLDPSSPGTLLFGILLAFPGAVNGACMGLLRAQERPGAFDAVALTASVGAQLLGIVGLLIEPTSLSYLVGYGLALIISVGVALRLTGAWQVGPASRQTLRAALNFSVPTIPSTLSIFVLAVGDRFVIQVIAGSSAVGKYQIAYAFGSVGIALISALLNTWIPIIFAAPEGERWTALADTGATVTRLAGLICGVIALIAETVLQVIVPAGYSPRLLAGVTAVVALASLPAATYAARSQVLYWSKQTRPLLWIVPAMAAFNLTLVALLIPPFGLRGAAAATVVALLAQAVLTHVVATRLIPQIPWEHGRDLWSYAIGSIAVAVALALPDTPASTAVRLSAAVLCGAAFVTTVMRELRPASSARAAT